MYISNSINQITHATRSLASAVTPPITIGATATGSAFGLHAIAPSTATTGATAAVLTAIPTLGSGIVAGAASIKLYQKACHVPALQSDGFATDILNNTNPENGKLQYAGDPNTILNLYGIFSKITRIGQIKVSNFINQVNEQVENKIIDDYLPTNDQLFDNLGSELKKLIRSTQQYQGIMAGILMAFAGASLGTAAGGIGAPIGAALGTLGGFAEYKMVKKKPMKH